jgi:hypothetical protein
MKKMELDKIGFAIGKNFVTKIICTPQLKAGHLAFVHFINFWL